MVTKGGRGFRMGREEEGGFRMGNTGIFLSLSDIFHLA